jgi:hypothetical protein
MFKKLMFTVMTPTGRKENSESLMFLIKSKYNKPYAETFIQDDQKVSVHLMITIQKVTSKIQTVSGPGPGGQ